MIIYDRRVELNKIEGINTETASWPKDHEFKI